MSVTPNFSWPLIEPTDFVTNLPADLELLADDIDADVWAIKGTADAALPETIIDAAGDLIYGTAADTAGRLAIGTAGQVLKVNAGATAPEWGTVSAGGMTLISDVTIGTGITTVSFTSISGSYKHLLITWEDLIRASGAGSFYFQFNQAGSSHIWANWKVNGTTVSGSTGNQGGSPSYPLPDAATPGNNGALWVFEYSDTTFRKPFEAFAYGYNSSNSQLEGSKTVGDYDSDTAITRIDFIANGALLNNRGTIKLYGVS